MINAPRAKHPGRCCFSRGIPFALGTGDVLRTAAEAETRPGEPSKLPDHCCGGAENRQCASTHARMGAGSCQLAVDIRRDDLCDLSVRRVGLGRESALDRSRSAAKLSGGRSTGALRRTRPTLAEHTRRQNIRVHLATGNSPRRRYRPVDTSPLALVTRPSPFALTVPARRVCSPLAPGGSIG